MATSQAVRVRVAAPAAWARRLVARFSRGGIDSAADDGTSPAEVLVAVGYADSEIAPLRARAEQLIVVGKPGALFCAAGADDVVAPGEPEILFRRVRAAVERADLNARMERLSGNMKALEEGLADAAHDLRSPLHAAMGHAELLASDRGLDDSQRASAAAAARQANRALQVAERILEGARTRDRRAIEAHATDLGKLVEAAAAGAQASAKARHLTIIATPPERSVEIRADREMLARLLDNLLANAVRITPRGGTIEVRAWRASPKLVRLAVKDSGPGIPRAEFAKLIAGLGPGRGLRICRDIAERHGGELWAESEVGQGAEFFVELPLAPPHATKPRVLLVSNDGRWVREVARTLRSACSVRSATVAAARLGKKRTDLVVLEAQHGDSPQLTALRNEAKGAQVPVIELPSQVAAASIARTLAHLA